MKIKFTIIEGVSDVSVQKRCAAPLYHFKKEKRRKRDSEISLVHEENSSKDVSRVLKKEKNAEIEASQISSQCSISNNKHNTVIASCNGKSYDELPRLKRNEHIMSCFSRALWNVLKEYKHKLEESQIEVNSLKEALGNEQTRIRLLEQELQNLRSLSSVQDHAPTNIKDKVSCLIEENDSIDYRVLQLIEEQLSSLSDICLHDLETIGNISQASTGEIASTLHSPQLQNGSLKETKEGSHVECSLLSDELKQERMQTLSQHIGDQFSSDDHSKSLLDMEQSILRISTKNQKMPPRGHYPQDISAAIGPITDDRGYVANHIEQIPLMEKVIISKPPPAGKPKRRLLPSSEMLLKEFSNLDIGIPNSKDGRNPKREELAERKYRSHGSNSLACLLRSNHFK